MGLLEGMESTDLALLLLSHDSTLSLPQSRGICYVELVSNRNAQAIASISHRLFTHLDGFPKTEALTLQKVIAFFTAEGVGTDEHFLISLQEEQERRREAHRFLRSLCTEEGFAPLHLLTYRVSEGYYLGHTSIGPGIMGYAIRRWWPRSGSHDLVPYLSYHEVQQLVSPLRLLPERFKDNLATLERRWQIIRITSSGLDQIRPEWERPLESLLWPGGA